MGRFQHRAAPGLAAPLPARAYVRLCAALCALSGTLLLASCGKEPPRREPPVKAADIPRTPLPTEQVLPAARPPANNLDDYKRLLAHKINEATPAATFTGAIPPLLTSIVVVEVKIERDGGIASLRVVRSRDQKASGIALAAMRSAAPYPRPGKLMPAHHKTFDVSETFLFNKDYRFQLRTLAPVQ
ncbi:hypothetical protein LJR289_005639 [Pseudoduganella sp. LjRoot289]|uniref:energy transducer TonB n=1 Tax=Pseudoduganella sp. LjRoot289 TaxID=3342314 RepID=UPI003ECCCB7D